MRIAVVNHHLSDVVGGSELQCHLLATGLAARGHEVIHVAVDVPGVSPVARPDGDAAGVDGTGALAAPGYRIVRSGPDGRSRRPGPLSATLVGLAPDVVYWRFNRRGGFRTVAHELARHRIPLVFAVAHVDDVSSWPSRPRPGAGATLRDRAADLRSRLEHRRASAGFRHVTALAAQRPSFVGRVGVGLERVVPNVMDPTSVPFSWPRPYVAWVANLKARKRPELLPSIAAALAPHEVDLLVAGPVQEARYAQLLSAQGRPANLHHLGALRPAEVTGLVGGATVVAVTSMPEGLSNVMIQAWWGGTPTVTLDYDPDDVVRDLGLGAVAEGDVDRFLDEVVRFAVDPEVRSAAGSAARTYARSRFAPEGVLDELEDLLSAAVEG